MSEDEAREWVAARFGHTALTKIAAFIDLLTDETSQQNLIAASTVNSIWARHVVDSAQLVAWAPPATEGDVWLDIGSGAGFPGLIVALLTDRAVALAEPRAKRAAFLTAAASALGVTSQVTVHPVSADRLSIPASVITARAVATLDRILALGERCSSPDTRWILPKGKGAREEVVSAQASWHGVFHVEQSITEPQSLIILASEVSRR